MTDRLVLENVSKPTLSPKRAHAAVDSNAYETDIYRWAREQAEHIRAGRFHLIDRINAADELEDVGKREEEALISNLEIVLSHMLKWDFQPARQSRSWEQTIAEHRERVEFRFAKAPTLSAKRDDLLAWAYKFARRRASRETKLPVATFPAACMYSWTDIMERPFDHGPDVARRS